MTGSIPLIRSRDIAREIQGSKGLLVVQLTSFETSCSFCIRSNPVFEEVAKDPANAKVRFLRVAYLPWTQMGSDAFAQAFAYIKTAILFANMVAMLSRWSCNSCCLAGWSNLLHRPCQRPHLHIPGALFDKQSAQFPYGCGSRYHIVHYSNVFVFDCVQTFFANCKAMPQILLSLITG